MYNTIPDYFKNSAVNALFSIPTFRGCWPTWQPVIHRFLGNNYDENRILGLGSHLSEIFESTGGGGRGQGELSAGGTAWESLVCWYINLCTVGSRTVAVRKMSLVPQPIQDAITVSYGNNACNTESDITIIIFPNLPDYNTDINQLNITRPNGTRIPTLVRGNINPELLNFLVDRDFAQHEIGIIQCKTNWNDNAQVPMLWDMVYSAGRFRGNITVGVNNYLIHNSHGFTYSFVTVPSNRRANYNGNSLAVKRVANLTGGNYWGKPTLQSVAKSVSEIFTINFSYGSRTNLRTDLRNAIPHLATGQPLAYFEL
jgi:hypothetical protein